MMTTDRANMSATINSICPQCGYIHNYVHDRMACEARHGHVWPVDGARDPLMVCAICGIEDFFSELLWHMRLMESRRDVRSGVLLRPIWPTRDVAEFEAD